MRRPSAPCPHFLAYRMTASNYYLCFLTWPLPETAMGILCDCLVGAFSIFVGRENHNYLKGIAERLPNIRVKLYKTLRSGMTAMCTHHRRKNEIKLDRPHGLMYCPAPTCVFGISFCLRCEAKRCPTFGSQKGGILLLMLTKKKSIFCLLIPSTVLHFFSSPAPSLDVTRIGGQKSGV